MVQSNYVQPFIESVQNVFETMMQVEATMHDPFVRNPNEPCHDVSGIIGMSGDATGAVVLSFPQETAERLVALFTGAEVTVEQEDFADAIGELVNMVAGGAKAKFDHCNISISIPSVIIGSGHKIFQQKSHPVVEIPCDCECGPFSVMISMKQVHADADSIEEAEPVQRI